MRNDIINSDEQRTIVEFAVHDLSDQTARRVIPAHGQHTPKIEHLAFHCSSPMHPGIAYVGNTNALDEYNVGRETLREGAHDERAMP